jgi:hypothetical protein
MFRFISIAVWNATHEEVNAEGETATVYTSPYRYSHSHARVNYEKTEVVLSLNYHTDDCDCLTHKQANQYIDSQWHVRKSE